MSSRPTDLAAARLDCDGQFASITLGPDTLGALYREIGCRTVEIVQLSDGLTMWLDEEGLYTAAVNPAATALAQHFGFFTQPYFGTVVFTGGADQDGNTLPLDVEVAAWLGSVLA